MAKANLTGVFSIEVLLGCAVLMHDPLRPYSLLFSLSSPHMEDQSLLHSNQALSRLDFPICTSWFPEPSLGFPVHPFLLLIPFSLFWIILLMLQALFSEEEPLLILRSNPTFHYSPRNQTWAQNFWHPKWEKSHDHVHYIIAQHEIIIQAYHANLK